MRPLGRALAALCLLAGTACGGRWAEPGNGGIRVADLPLVEVPARAPRGGTCVVLLSGDGGWARLDKEMAEAFAASGCPVAGLNSLRYFWTPRTPDSAAQDLERICRHSLGTWKAQRLVLVGYSFGADVLPFLVNRLSPELRARIPLVALVGLGDSASFEFHLSGWLGWGPRGPQQAVLPELRRLRGPRVLCVDGAQDPGRLGPELDAPLAKRVLLPGSHHFGGDYRSLARVVLGELDAGASGPG
ncbi:MAG: AcvB/VirJ family lysyl-phosphatidylglycerol hydrolase [Holophaga sp.]|nr:AcvB/VirJ family lysyl-phosphatidylglycerol hydrolase [Holophaga sp.]